MSLITTNTAKFRDLVIGGGYTATLFAGVSPNPGGSPLVSTAIAQTGLIPLGTRSLRFSVQSFNPVIYLKVTLDGQDMPIFPLLAGSNYEVYAADISAFAGLTAELRFTEPLNPDPNAPRFTLGYLDDISFSPQAVPEPSVFGLLPLGSLLLGWRFWKRRA